MKKLKSKFNFVLSIGRLNNKAMSLSVLVGDKKIYEGSPKESTIYIDFDCELPNQIVFEFGDKFINDTIVDKSGRIIQDKHIKIEKVSIDNMPVEQWIVESRLFEFVPKNNKTIHTNYFGYNGKAYMNIKNNDSFDYFLNLLAEK